MKVLIIEDDPQIIETVALILELRWPEASLVSTFFGEKGVELVKKDPPDIVVLDLGLPDIDGFQVLRQIRTFSDVPVVILTVMGAEVDKIKGLELGADDYIVKPFSAGEFLARVKALLRRKEIPGKPVQVVGKPFIRGKFRVDFTSGEVSVGDKLVKLTPGEYKLLYHLVLNEGMSLSNETLLEKVWGPEPKADAEYLKLCVKGLKGKLESEAGNPTMILDEEGEGYKFVSA